MLSRVVARGAVATQRRAGATITRRPHTHAACLVASGKRQLCTRSTQALGRGTRRAGGKPHCRGPPQQRQPPRGERQTTSCVERQQHLDAARISITTRGVPRPPLPPFRSKRGAVIGHVVASTASTATEE
ncbi:unnamed protein product [Laminaria digitata]